MIENVLNNQYEDRVKSGFYTNIYQSASNELRRLSQILHIDLEQLQAQLELFLFADSTTLRSCDILIFPQILFGGMFIQPECNGNHSPT